MGKRGRILVVGLTVLPLVAAAGLWARGYWRRDLVSWEERGLALVPQWFEVGCWSGCVVDGGSGAPLSSWRSASE